MALLNTIKSFFGRKKKDEEEVQQTPIAIPKVKMDMSSLSQKTGAQDFSQVPMSNVNPIDLSIEGNLKSSLSELFKNVSGNKISVQPPPKPVQRQPIMKTINNALQGVADNPRVKSFVEYQRNQPLIPSIPQGPKAGGAIDLGVAVAQAFPRALLRVGMTRDRMLGPNRPTSFTPTTPIDKILFGKDDVTSIDEGIKRASKTLQDYGVSDIASTPLAGLGVIAGTTLDLVPGVGSGGKKGAIKTSEELASIIQKELKVAPVALNTTEDVVRVGWKQVENLLSKLDVDKNLLKKLNAGDVIEGTDFVIQKQGDKLMANIDKAFKPAVLKVSKLVNDTKGVKLGKNKQAKEIVAEAPKVVDEVVTPNVQYVDPKLFAESISTDTHLGTAVGRKKLNKLKVPDYALEPGALDRNQVEAVKSSLLAGDKINPLVLNEAGEIEDGAHRFVALQELGAKDAEFVTRTKKMGSYSYDPATDPRAIAKAAKDEAKLAEQTAKREYKEWVDNLYQTIGIRTTRQAVNDAAKAVKANTSSPLSDITKIDDIGLGTGAMRDVYRNFQSAYGESYPQVKQILLDPFDEAKDAFTRNQQALIKELDETIVKGLGIKKGSKESAMIQLYGEADDVGKAEILKSLPLETGQKIAAADEWFRSKYDQLLDEVNEVRASIYGDDPDKLIPKRSDYYRHFQELQDGFQGLKNIFEQPSGIGSELAGRSEFMKPLSKFLSIAQKRKGEKTQIDAVGGFLNYIKASEYAKNIDPYVGRFRALAEELSTKLVDSENPKQLDNFIQFLRGFSDDLSGKTSGMLERSFPKIFGEKGGRKILSVLSWVNSRVKANVVLGNISSSISQIWNVPQAIADVGFRRATESALDAIAQVFKAEKKWDQSNFINERYISREYEQFDTGMLNDVKKFAVWMTSALDEVGTRFIWNAQYRKALDEGISDAAKYADEATRRMVGGRGVGEVPLLQKDRVFQLVAPFQLEVGNMWWVMRDWVSEKEFSKFAKFFVTTYFMNRAMEQIGANPIGFDPIQAGIEATTEEDLSPLQRVGRVGGEVLSQTPGANTIIPQFLSDTETKQLFGRRDPTRFGSGLLLSKGFEDPLFKILPSFGGGQIRKTLEGVSSVNRGYEENKAGLATYPIRQSTPNYIKGFLFGKHSLPEAQEYYRNEETPLGTNDTIMLRALLDTDEDLGFAFYEGLLNRRDVSSIMNDVRAKEAEVRLILTNPQATSLEKQEAINALQEEARKASEKLNMIQSSQEQTPETQAFDAPVVPLQSPAMPSTLNLTKGSGGSGKVKFKVGALPKGKGISLKTKAQKEESQEAPDIKPLTPPKVSGVRLSQTKRPKKVKPRRFKVSGLTVRA